MSISSPPNYGSPDWQRGYYSAQKELSTGNVGTGVVTVTIPPNCETLIVLLENPAQQDSAAAKGVTTGYNYPGIGSFNNRALSSTRTFFFDVSATLDTQMQIFVTAQLGGQWSVYADAGVHIVGDVGRYTNLPGAQYVVPTVPNVSAGDHPLNELQHVNNIFAANGNLLNAPGAGTRYRVFSAQLIVITGSSNCQMGGTDGTFCYARDGNPGNITFGPSGFPLPDNSPVEVFIGPSITVGAVVIYTQETI